MISRLGSKPAPPSIFSMRSVAMKSSVFSSRRTRAASPMLMAPAICPFAYASAALTSQTIVFRAIASATYWPSTMIVDVAAAACAHRNESAMSMKRFMTSPPSLRHPSTGQRRWQRLPACDGQDSTPRWDRRLLHCGISIQLMSAWGLTLTSRPHTVGLLRLNERSWATPAYEVRLVPRSVLSAPQQTLCLLSGLPNLDNPRHSDCKGRATTGLALDPNVAAHHLTEPLADHEAEPG